MRNAQVERVSGAAVVVVVTFLIADQTVREFVYTVKATAVGSFAIPPAFGEGMYDRSVRAWSQPGRIVVHKAP